MARPNSCNYNSDIVNMDIIYVYAKDNEIVVS